MDYGHMVGDSCAYAKDAVIGRWMQWLLLVIATILFCIPLLGYSLTILRGGKPAPEVTGWGTLFIDGIRCLIVVFIWAIPCIILLCLALVPLFASVFVVLADHPGAAMALFSEAMMFMALFVVAAIITGLLGTIGVVRFARTGSMGSAFSFSGILGTIGKIGWGNYILAMIVLAIAQVIIGIILYGISLVPFLGCIIQLILVAPILLFGSRYVCLVYDAAGAVS